MINVLKANSDFKSVAMRKIKNVKTPTSIRKNIRMSGCGLNYEFSNL